MILTYFIFLYVVVCVYSGNLPGNLIGFKFPRKIGVRGQNILKYVFVNS